MKRMKRQTVRQLLGFLQPWRSTYLVSLIGLAVVLTSERIFIAFVIKMFVDAIIGVKLDMLWQSLIAWLVFLVAWIPLNLVFSYWWRSTTIRAVANLRQRVFAHIQRLPLGYHEQRHSGDLLAVMTSDISVAEQAFQQDMLNLVNATLQAVSAATVMLTMNWQLALVIVGSGFIPLALNAAFARPLRKAGDAVQERLGGVSERLTDLLAGFQVVRTFDLADWILERFGAANHSLVTSGMHRVRLEAVLAGANSLSMIGFLLPMAVGSYMVLNGQTSFGILVALIQLNNPINFFVTSLSGSITRIQSSLAAADRILAVLDTPMEPERYSIATADVDGPADGSTQAMLEFRQVSFSYASGKEVLHDMSFRVEKGQTAAFVGPSGGGKSTIFKLLLGCYEVRQGAVVVAGKSANTSRLSELRDWFAYIPQDAYLYSGTILENISYGKPGAGRDEVIAAARAAYAHDFISEFQNGYDTVVGERGARLSGGQRQRIAIARALLKDAPVLLLDEATSALDSESEELVQRALNALMRGRTVLVIAHRLSTIEHADVIYAVDGGTVVEAGSHEELMARKGLFYRLHEMQFQDEAEAQAA